MRPALSTKLLSKVCMNEELVGFPVAGDTAGIRGIGIRCDWSQEQVVDRRRAKRLRYMISSGATYDVISPPAAYKALLLGAHGFLPSASVHGHRLVNSWPDVAVCDLRCSYATNMDPY